MDRVFPKSLLYRKMISVEALTVLWWACDDIVCFTPLLQMADRYIPQVVLNQLRYSGMMETVRIRRAGFPVRRIFDDFLHRYHVLGRSMGIGKNDSKHGCHRILQKYDSEGKNWQLGMTKVSSSVCLGLPLTASGDPPYYLWGSPTTYCKGLYVFIYQ